MDRAIAEKLMEQYHLIGDSFNRATEIISTITDTAEQKRLRQPIGKLMANIWTDLMLPIVKEHPDLDPDNQAQK